MKEITRYIDATETTDYILPAITLGPTKYQDRAIHIGVDKGNGEVACLCGLHHKQKPDVWQSPSIAVSPDITCGGCLRSMKSLIKGSSSKPYMLIMKKIGQKIDDAKFHVKIIGSNSSNGEIYDVAPESRIDSISRIQSDGSLLGACYYRSFIPGAFFGVGFPMETDVFHITNFDAVIRHDKVLPICKESYVDNGKWIEVTKEVQHRVTHITCPKCAEIYLKQAMVVFPRRDKTYTERERAITAQSNYLGGIYNKYKAVFEYVVNAPKDEVISPAWKQIVDDYTLEYNNMQLLYKSIEEVF